MSRTLILWLPPVAALADETANNKTAAPARTRMDVVFIAEHPVPTRGNASNDDGGA